MSKYSIKTFDFISYTILLSISMCLFYKFGLALVIAFGLLLYVVLIRQYYPRFRRIDIFIFIYFIWSSILYYTLDVEIKYYNAIILFPLIIFILSSTRNNKVNNLEAINAFLIVILVYSILSFFRNSYGEFSLNISDNIYLNQRIIDDSIGAEEIRYFRNATLMSIWLITSFIFSLTLFNHTKKKRYFALIIFITILIFLSNTKSAIGCTMIIIAINYLFIKRQKFSNLIKLILILIPAIFLLIELLGTSFTFQQDRILEIFTNEETRGLGNRHTIYWPMAIVYIFNDIWGYGHLYFVEEIGRSTHNEILGQFVALGIVPAVFYYIIIFNYLYYNYKILKNKNSSSTIWNEIAFYMLITYLITGMTEHISLGNYYWIAIMFFAIGCSKSTLSFSQKLPAYR